MTACPTCTQPVPAHVPALAHKAPPGQVFLHTLQAHIAQMSTPAVELAAALVAVQPGLPQVLSDWTLAELGQRADLSQVSPLALAAMKIGLRSSMMHLTADLEDSSADFALIRLMGRDAALKEARQFLALLVHQLEQLAQPTQ